MKRFLLALLFATCVSLTCATAIPTNSARQFASLFPFPNFVQPDITNTTTLITCVAGACRDEFDNPVSCGFSSDVRITSGSDERTALLILADNGEFGLVARYRAEVPAFTLRIGFFFFPPWVFLGDDVEQNACNIALAIGIPVPTCCRPCSFLGPNQPTSFSCCPGCSFLNP